MTEGSFFLACIGFFAPTILIHPQSETIPVNTSTDMVVEAAPASPFIVVQPDFLFQFEIIAFDTPAQLACRHRVPGAPRSVLHGV